MRYLRVYRSFWINCLSRAMEFRAQFFAAIIGYLIWTGVSLVFIQAVFGHVGAVSGWTQAEMWVLYGTYVIIESLCYGLLGPNMFRFSTMVRDGTLDMVLTKPLNSQFFLSARYIDVNGVLNCVPGAALLWLGLSRVGHSPNFLQWTLWLSLLVCGFVMAYSLWFAFVTCSIWAVKLEGIAVVFDPMMQIARFPVQVYPRRLQPLLTIFIPVAFMTTYPAQALLGRGGLATLAAAIVLAGLFLLLAAQFFQFALRYYSSASS